jgi:glycosyltransferase involved in cell wall biosynthesis
MNDRSPGIDITLLLEGTYPYVSGGVSSWVAQILGAFPEYRFALVFLGGRASDYGRRKYVLPDNVKHLERYYLHDDGGAELAAPSRSDDGAAFCQIAQLHDKLRRATNVPADQLAEHFSNMLGAQSGIQEADFLYSRAAWDYIALQYRERCTDPSFTDYFWNVRAMHRPIWALYRIAQHLPRSRVYHTVSTGYAGLLGAMLNQLHGRPLIVSEHGLYTKERKIDLFQTDWIRDNRDVFQKNIAEVAYFRTLWIRFFGSLGRLCYASAKVITGLNEEIRLQQLADGAPAARTLTIPNGVDVPRFLPVRARRAREPRPLLCLIGRVVPVKDIKTFIRAMRTIVTQLPHAEGWIVGPDDEDREYAAECHALVASLGLETTVKFLGFRKVEDVLADARVLVLSSISEAQPLVILEAFASGVPVVATDVGSCRELVLGMDADDRALGPAGAVVRISDPVSLAEAALNILTDPATYAACAHAGIRRVEARYTQARMFARFRSIYRSLLDETCAAGTSDGGPVRDDAQWRA